MKTFRRIALATLLAIVTLSSSAQVEPSAVAQTGCSYDFSAVTALILDAVSSVPLDGASLMLIKDGQVIYERYFGSYNADTAVFIASASKWLAGATLMTLVDEGKLSLNDQVSEYLPYFTGMKGTMTIRQMFSHTSGLPGIADDASCLFNPFVTMDVCARQIAQLDLIGAPGAQFAYGENSMQVAGRICEIVSGKSWESLFQEKIATPLGMDGATFGPSNNPIVGGGARSKLNDYANFLRMVLNEGQFSGKRVLSVESVREMQRNLTAGLPVASSPTGGSAVNYAIGEWIDILDAQGNAVQLSSPGAFGFTPWVDKKRNLLGVFLVQNQRQNQRQNVSSTVAMVQQKAREAVDACARPMAGVSAASYDGTALAPESVAAAFGSNLATMTAIAETTPLPTSLAGTVLRVQDGAGNERMAPLFFVSPTQINFQIPPGTAHGSATLTVTSGDGSLSLGAVQIAPVAPGVFSADASGGGLAAATVLRIKADGSEVYEPVARFDPATSKFVAVPIDVSAAGGQVYLILFGTGFRHRSALQAVSVKFGGVDGQVLFAGAQNSFIGLDQLNILLPSTLAGRGEVDVVLTADGKAANTVRIAVK